MPFGSDRRALYQPVQVAFGDCGVFLEAVVSILERLAEPDGEGKIDVHARDALGNSRQRRPNAPHAHRVERNVSRDDVVSCAVGAEDAQRFGKRSQIVRRRQIACLLDPDRSRLGFVCDPVHDAEERVRGRMRDELDARVVVLLKGFMRLEWIPDEAQAP